MTLTNLLRHISLKHVKHQKTRTFMGILGITLGVASMVSIDIVNNSVLFSFEDSINRITGRAALEITGAETGFPEQVLDRVQNIAGVEFAVPVIETTARLADGKERPLLILGVDALQDHQVRSYSLRDESADIPDPLLFLAKPDSILLTSAMAEQEGVKLDQQIRLQTVQGIKTLTVRGLLNPEGLAKAAGGDIAVMDVYAAQLAFGKKGKFDRIDVSFLAGETFDVMKERIQAVLTEGYRVDTPAVRTKQVEIMTARFRKSISLVSLLAVFVGMYLIYNAVSITVVQRRREIGILRALGATRRQIIGLFLGEAFAVSAVGSLLGIGLGFLFAKLSVGAVAQNISDLYMRASVTDLNMSSRDLLVDAGIGILASMIAAVFPSRTAARITPISAIRTLPYSGDGAFFGKTIKIVSGLCVLLSAIVLVLYYASDLTSPIRNTTTMFLSMVLLLLGVSLATPLFLRYFLSFVHRFLTSIPGGAGRLAGLNLQKNIVRNSVAVAAIFYSIALAISTASLVYSTRASLMDYVDSIIRADLLVSSGHPLATGGMPNIPMPGEMKKDLEKVPGVRFVDTFRKTYLNYQDRQILLEIVDFALRMEYCPLLIVEGNREKIRRLLPNQDYITVNEHFAKQFRTKPGDVIVLPTPDGPKRFGVAAIVVSYSGDAGIVWIDNATYQRHWKDSLIDTFEVVVKPGTDISALRQAILDRFGKERKLFVLPVPEAKAEIEKMLDQMFVMNNAVNIITLIIAGIGVIVTLLASVLERTREIGILRSIGMKKSQVSGLVLLESMMLGAAGGVLGTATGALIGWISLEGFMRVDFGGNIQYHIHYPSVAWAMALAIGLAALAGLYPAWRAAKTNITEALSYE